MSERTNFIDYIRIFCKSGHGGAGAKHFMRNKLTAKGGPDGGNGGRGGHIILKGNKQIWTLLHLRYKKIIHAHSGENGSKNNCTGLDGVDIIIEVPLGTIARFEETNQIACEIVNDQQTFILMKGGRGGLGNSNFATPTNQVPEHAQPGEAGVEGNVILELKILADVGIVGFPNAGKSTLLSVISNAKPQIANYPFTTITPQLGIVAYRESHSFCVADIPGLIEGASEGKGLGHRFLRHIERNSVLLFLIPIDSQNILAEFESLKNELEKYNPLLLRKKYLIAVSKSDIFDEAFKTEIKQTLPNSNQFLFISSATMENITELKDKLWSLLNEE